MKVEFFIKSIKDAYAQNEYLKVCTVFLLFFFSFVLAYFSINQVVTLDDHFFHFRFAEMIRDNGFGVFKDFHWLYFSKISEGQYLIYYNFLFYVILIPFTYIQPLVLSIKLYGALFAAISFSSIYFFLLKIKEKNSFLWTILIFSLFNISGVFRFFLSRPYTFSPILLLLELYLLYKRKYGWVFATSFVYLFWHSATFYMPLAIAGVYFLFENLYTGKYNWKNILYSGCGVALAVILVLFFSPGFGYFIYDGAFGIFKDVILGNKVNIAEGVELYPLESIDYIKTNIPLFILFVFAISFEIVNYIQEKKEKVNLSALGQRRILRGSLFFISLVFFVGSLGISRRLGDYFIIFGAVYIVVALNQLIAYLTINNNIFRKILFSSLTVIIVYLFGTNIFFIYEKISTNEPYNSIEGTALWLKNNVPSKEIVFNTTWNFFPRLFYYNPNNYYIAGIEPKFLYDYSPELYWSWRNISEKGYVCVKENCDDLEQAQGIMKASLNVDKRKAWYNVEGNIVADYITDKFNSHFIVTSREFSRFNDLMDNSNRFERVFTDNIYKTFFVYKINSKNN